ncbi:MAG: hypothetical protein ACFFFT_18510 [Candidatus Thorarchaeota archaeon]
MSYTIAKEKFPKKPVIQKVLEVCKRDFKNFKNDDENRVIEYFQSEIKKIDHLETPNSVLIEQKDRLEMIRDLIREGKDDVAFSIFFRTFPSCLPYRTRNL